MTDDIKPAEETPPRYSACSAWLVTSSRPRKPQPKEPNNRPMNDKEVVDAEDSP